MTRKPDYENIEKLEQELGIVEPLKKAVGIPVVKKSRKVRDPTPNIPKKVHGRDEVNITVVTKDFTCVKVPGKVEDASVMRLIDAKGRKLISDKIFSEVLEIRGLGLEDRVTIVPEIKYSCVSGYNEVRYDDGTLRYKMVGDYEVPKSI